MIVEPLKDWPLEDGHFNCVKVDHDESLMPSKAWNSFQICLILLICVVNIFSLLLTVYYLPRHSAHHFVQLKRKIETVAGLAKSFSPNQLETSVLHLLEEINDSGGTVGHFNGNERHWNFSAGSAIVTNCFQFHNFGEIYISSKKIFKTLTIGLFLVYFR